MTDPNDPRLGRPDRDRGEPAWWLEFLPELAFGVLLAVIVGVILIMTQ